MSFLKLIKLEPHRVTINGAPNRGRIGSRYAQDSALSMHPAFDR